METIKARKSIVFDEVVMKRVFDEHLLPCLDDGARILACRRLWSKYLPLKETIQAIYQVDFTGPNWSERSSQKLYLSIPGKTNKEPKSVDKEEMSGDCGFPLSRIYVPTIDMLIQVFPADLKLPQLKTLVQPQAMAPYLQELSDSDLGLLRISVLKYKPEKRCVLRYDFSDQVKKLSLNEECSWIGKTFCNDRGRENFNIMQFLIRAGVPVPKPYSYTPELKLLLTEALPGRELGASVCGLKFPEYVKKAATVIAGLHSVPVDDELVNVVTFKEEIEKFTRLTKRIEREFPPLTKSLHHLSSMILSNYKSSHYEHLTFVHGELDPSQFLVHDSGVWLVDFDRFMIAHPALDIGRFLAYFSRLSLKHHDSSIRFDALEKLFLEEYLKCFSSNPLNLILICQAIECVKIASRFVQRRKTGWESRAITMCEKAENVLSDL